ncbi:MAG: dienelactone hydrolase family protein, partial [Pseudomonadota bacterium]
MKNLFFSITLFLLGSSAALAAVQGKEIAYTADGTTLKGWIAYDDAFKGKRAAVLVVHEWWGHNAYARKRANMLAELGYVALAVD